MYYVFQEYYNKYNTKSIILLDVKTSHFEK